jgi:hypothetical protein
MSRFLYFSGILLIYAFTAIIPVSAQSQNASSRELTPGLRNQTLVLSIESRVLGEKKTVIWTETNSKVTLPGSSVGIQLVGSNIVVVAQFTPFIRREGNVLVAQGQIWVADTNETVTYYTSIQTIPMEFGEKIYFFPLGSSEHLNPSIEIIITVTSNDEDTNQRGNTVNTGNGR